MLKSYLNIVGDGAFGSFLKELLAPKFEFSDFADSVVLAVPIQAYDELGEKYKNKHLINVCSVQELSTNILLKYTDKVTSIHPLFGRRTPDIRRNSIFTRSIISNRADDTWFFGDKEKEEQIFLERFGTFSKIFNMSPQEHDKLMAKTHATALLLAQQAKVFTDRVKDINQDYLPNSFRMFQDFVKTLEDMPQGTRDSILANTYI